MQYILYLYFIVIIYKYIYLYKLIIYRANEVHNMLQKGELNFDSAKVLYIQFFFSNIVKIIIIIYCYT